MSSASSAPPPLAHQSAARVYTYIYIRASLDCCSTPSHSLSLSTLLSFHPSRLLYIYTQGLLIFFRIPHRTLFHPPCGIDSPLSKDRGARESAACSCTRYIGIIIHTDTNARARAIDRLRSEPAPRARE